MFKENLTAPPSLHHDMEVHDFWCKLHCLANNKNVEFYANVVKMGYKENIQTVFFVPANLSTRNVTNN